MEDKFLYRVKRCGLEPFCVNGKRRREQMRQRFYAMYTGETKRRSDNKRWYLIRDVSLSNGLFVADHIWIPAPQFGPYQPNAGDKCTFTGYIYRYHKPLRRGYWAYQYGIDDVKKLESCS